MTSSHQKLLLSEAVPGMALSENVLDAHGNILLPQGSTLTEAIIRSLNRRGVEALSVVADNAEPEIDQAAQRERHRVRLPRLFRKCNGDEECRFLLNLMTHYRLGEKS